MTDKKYIEAISILPPRINSALSCVDDSLQRITREISIRINKPLVIHTFKGAYFVGTDCCSKSPQNSFIVTADDVSDCIKSITEYSIHTYKDKINAGYITIKGGHRVGVVGSCSYSHDKQVAVNDLSSINLRVARQIKGIARPLVKQLYAGGVCSTLIVGCPASGKTTLLRDMALWLSGVDYGQKVSIIDERSEIAAVYAGVPQNDVGVFADVLDGYKKGDGMRLAVRAMSPNVLIVDEIGGADDAQAIADSFNAGVSVIATVHAGSIDELYKKTHILPLIKNGFTKLVMLSGAENPCIVSKIVSNDDDECGSDFE